MNFLKIPPKHPTNSVMNQISDYLRCIKVGIFICIYQVPEQFFKLVSTKHPQNINKRINSLSW